MTVTLVFLWTQKVCEDIILECGISVINVNHIHIAIEHVQYICTWKNEGLIQPGLANNILLSH